MLLLLHRRGFFFNLKTKCWVLGMCVKDRMMSCHVMNMLTRLFSDNVKRTHLQHCVLENWIKHHSDRGLQKGSNGPANFTVFQETDGTGIRNFHNATRNLDFVNSDNISVSNYWNESLPRNVLHGHAWVHSIPCPVVATIEVRIWTFCHKVETWMTEFQISHWKSLDSCAVSQFKINDFFQKLLLFHWGEVHLMTPVL